MDELERILELMGLPTYSNRVNALKSNKSEFPDCKE
jgi:hypothetical protein